MNPNWTDKEKYLIFEKTLSEFSDNDWVDLYKALDKYKEEQKDDTKTSKSPQRR